MSAAVGDLIEGQKQDAQGELGEGYLAAQGNYGLNDVQGGDWGVGVQTKIGQAKNLNNIDGRLPENRRDRRLWPPMNCNKYRNKIDRLTTTPSIDH